MKLSKSIYSLKKQISYLTASRVLAA